MKIILNKQASKISESITNQIVNLLKAHGIKLKQNAIMQMQFKIYCSLGGKKKNYKV